MKFNEKELALWASSFVSDREGLLDKKGAARGQGYKQRWFRLKGNLLFYFKVNECGEWESTGNEPLGVILLERCHVDRTQHDTRPHTFSLTFENDDSRSYDLSAYSEQDMDNWIKAIRMASYEGLRATLYRLQNKLLSATGEDPLKEKGVSIIGPGGGLSPKHNIREVARVKRTAYVRVTSKARAQSLAVNPSRHGPQYELSISCTQLPPADDGTLPTTLVRTRCYRDHTCTTHSPLPLTEIIESSCSPSYSHLLLLEVGPSYPTNGILRFEVFSIDTCLLSDTETDPSFILDPESVGKCIGMTECLVRSITSGKKLTLNLLDKKLVCGFLHVAPVKLEEKPTGTPKVPRRNAMTLLDRGSPMGILPTILSRPVRCHFSFSGGQTGKLKVIEEMAECVFNLQIPIELLKCYIREDSSVLNDLVSIGALEESWVEPFQEYQAILFDSIGAHKHALKNLENTASAEMCGSKPSRQKKNELLKFVPCNLHIQRMRVQSNQKEKAYSVVTYGCPADHVTGFKNGGLRRLLSECRSSPSFISKWTKGKASMVKHSLARLDEIRTNISQHKNMLYRACANASPLDMNEAVIGISKEVQQLLYLMQSGVVTDSIECLITARPKVVDKTADGFLGLPSKDMKRLSMKRRSAMIGGGRCNCGRCLKCIPSPSDWVWNGRNFVQVSTRDWKMDDSCDSIQETLVTLVEAVENATKRVVEQQHEAVAKEVGYGFTTYTPTYVWSSDLIPLVTQLNQTIDGLCKVASSSLSFSLVQVDSHVQGLQEIKRRRDVVFAQALTALVTSFYLSLSQNYMDAMFLRQIREIGFLAHFESLLSSMGDENGMLEDMCVAVAELANASFQLTEKSDRDLPFDFHITGTRDALTIQFLLAREYIAALPDELLQAGAPISVVPVLFTQGVNEKQTLAVLKQHIQLQDDINHNGLEVLSIYVQKYIDILSKSESSQASVEIVEAKDLLDSLKQSYASNKSKNVEFLMSLERLCRRLNGGRLTSCKSGKDRTSMSVTLEECSLLKQNHNLDDTTFSRTLATLRSHGTRLENCFKSTGHRCYHFNKLQLTLLPKLLTPPPYTCQKTD